MECNEYQDHSENQDRTGSPKALVNVGDQVTTHNL